MAGKKNKTSEYRKGQEIKVHIIDIGMRGEGIGKLEDGYTVFIKDAVIGDCREAVRRMSAADAVLRERTGVQAE